MNAGARQAGARPGRPAGELAEFVGKCARVYEDERLGHIRIVGGAGKPAAEVAEAVLRINGIVKRRDGAVSPAATVHTPASTSTTGGQLDL